MGDKLDQAEFEKLVAEVKGDCDKCKMDCRNRLKIIDSQIEMLRAFEDEHQGVLNEMRAMITQLKALYQINMRILNIVNVPEKAGETDETNFTARFTQ